MNIAFIGCMVLNREISLEASRSENCIRSWWLRQDFHNTPEKLKQELQKTVDVIEEEQGYLPDGKKFDYICLGYGLCSDSVVGIESRSIPLVIPKCDDCLSLFLGSCEKYRELFEMYPGTYWYNPGWIETAFTPSEQSYKELYKKYTELYGEENAEFLMEAENGWKTKYSSCIYIESPAFHKDEYLEYTIESAKYFGWKFHHEEGNMEFFKKILNGPWDEKEFCICAPDSRVVRVYDERKLIGEER